jgi:high-affinity iron transporter
VVGAALVAVVAAAGVSAAAYERGGGPSSIVVSDRACAPGWDAPPAGRGVLTVENRSHTTYAVDLVGRDQVSVYGEIETLAPGTSDSMDVDLPDGSFTLQCESFAGGELYSRPVQVQGAANAAAGPAFTPVTSDQLHLATLAYRARLVPAIGRLVDDTDALTRAVVAGRLGTARQLWLPAHLDYERLGAAYDTFGPLDAQIDGRPAGLVNGVHDAHLQGFLRLEYGLWHGQSGEQLTPVARALDDSVHQLATRFPKLPTGENDLSLRTHEILENSLQFELSGADDEGSHSEIATAWANVQGTELALRPLAPLLSRSDPTLATTATRGLQRLATTFLSYRRPDGSWQSLSSLTRPQREHLDSATSALLERLSQIPGRLEIPRRPPSDNDEQSDD